MFLIDKVVRVVGLSRSGNHAVIDWILRQLSGRWCFLNCVEPKSDPVVSARPLHDGRRAIAAHARLAAEPGVRSEPRDWMLFSQEDTFLGPALGPEASRIQEAALGRPRERYDVIILRDPFNLMASRRRLSSAVISESTAMRIWKQHARAVLRCRAEGGRVLPIRYASWVRDPAYRQRISSELGLAFSDDGVDRVHGCGGGSSFDGLAFDGRAREMAVFDRWRRYAGDPSFRSLFDRQAVELCEQLHPEPLLEEPIAWARAQAMQT